MFLSYQVAQDHETGAMRTVLKEFETRALPVNVVYPYAKFMSSRGRSFVDECVAALRKTNLG
jgi:hypothetical protein